MPPTFDEAAADLRQIKLGPDGIPAPGVRPRPEPPADDPSPCLCPCGGRLYLERSKWRCSSCGLFPEACCNGARG